MNVDGRLSDAELAKVIDDHARHDPVLVVRRDFHPLEGGVLAQDVVHRFLQKEDIR